LLAPVLVLLAGMAVAGCAKEQPGHIDCGKVLSTGFCDGEMLYWCEHGEALRQDCSEEGLKCVALSAEAGFVCAEEPAACGDVDEAGKCTGGDFLLYCDEGKLAGKNCRKDDKICALISSDQGFGCIDEPVGSGADGGGPGIDVVSQGGDTVVSEATIEDYCAESALAWCDLFVRCPTDPLMAAYDRKYCHGTQEAWCLAVIKPSVLSGRAFYHSSPASQLHALLGELTCGEFVRSEKRVEINQLGAETFTGTIPTGKACYGHVECEGEDDRCSATESTCPGTCFTRYGPGEECSGSSDCREDLFCSDIDRCESRKGMGQLCDSSSECEPGLLCRLDMCVQIQVAGEGCLESADACVYSVCQDAICHPLPGLGEDCLIYEGCSVGYCDFGKEVCMAVGIQGEECWFTDECGHDFACVDDQCEPLAGVGEGCVENAQCTTFACLDGSCSAVASSDNNCTLGCQPGAAECIDGAVFSCESDGLTMTEIETCGDGQKCMEGECKDCVEEDHKGCSWGDVYWYDSCGNKGEVYDECSSSQNCSSGKCVTPGCNCWCQCSGCSIDLDCDGSGCGPTCYDECWDSCTSDPYCGGYISSSGSCY